MSASAEGGGESVEARAGAGDEGAYSKPGPGWRPSASSARRRDKARMRGSADRPACTRRDCQHRGFERRQRDVREVVLVV